MSQIKILPSILSADFSRLGDEVSELCQAGADYIHVDIMDGHFVPNITIGPCVVEQIKKYSTVPLDVHLMINNPGKYIKNFVNAGADFLSIHVESDGFHPALINDIKTYGVKAGIAISPTTNPAVLDDLMKSIDLVLIMTVEPGFGNQKFLTNQLEKICAVKAKAEHLGLSDLFIEVDGGINQNTAGRCINAGANLLVAGSYIFGDQNYKERIKSLRASTVHIN